MNIFFLILNRKINVTFYYEIVGRASKKTKRSRTISLLYVPSRSIISSRYNPTLATFFNILLNRERCEIFKLFTHQKREIRKSKLDSDLNLKSRKSSFPGLKFPIRLLLIPVRSVPKKYIILDRSLIIQPKISISSRKLLYLKMTVTTLLVFPTTFHCHNIQGQKC